MGSKKKLKKLKEKLVLYKEVKPITLDDLVNLFRKTNDYNKRLEILNGMHGMVGSEEVIGTLWLELDEMDRNFGRGFY